MFWGAKWWLVAIGSAWRCLSFLVSYFPFSNLSYRLCNLSIFGLDSLE